MESIWPLGRRPRNPCVGGSHRRPGLGEPVRSSSALHVVWSPDGRRLASCGDDDNVYLWDAANGTMLAKLQGHRGMVKNIAWSPDGRRLASCGGAGGGELLIWDAHSGACLSNWREPGAVINAVAWHPSGTILVCGSSDGKLHWRSAESGEDTPCSGRVSRACTSHEAQPGWADTGQLRR